jgi:hypothetical protein
MTIVCPIGYFDLRLTPRETSISLHTVYSSMLCCRQSPRYLTPTTVVERAVFLTTRSSTVDQSRFIDLESCDLFVDGLSSQLIRSLPTRMQTSQVESDQFDVFYVSPNPYPHEKPDASVFR